MSRKGVTGNATSSGRPGPLRSAAHGRSSRRTTSVKWREAGGLRQGQGLPHVAIRRVAIGPDHDGRGNSSPGPPWSAAYLRALASPVRSTRTRPCAGRGPRHRRAIAPRDRRPRPGGRAPRSPPGQCGRRDRQANGAGRPFDPRAEVDEHHEERDQLQDDVQQRREVQLEMVGGRAPDCASAWGHSAPVARRQASGSRASCGAPAGEACGRPGRTAPAGSPTGSPPPATAARSDCGTSRKMRSPGPRCAIPSRVANSAVEMPSASCPACGEAPEVAMTWNDRIMP